MANKFIIHYSTDESTPTLYWWQLETNGTIVLSTGKEFTSEEACRKDIAKLKKAITRYTKVELYAGD